MVKTNIAKELATVVKERGAEVIISVMIPREKAGQELHLTVAAAMKEADVVFSPVSYSITHTYAVKEAAEAGTRIIVMTDFTDELMIGGGIDANFD